MVILCWVCQLSFSLAVEYLLGGSSEQTDKARVTKIRISTLDINHGIDTLQSIGNHFPERV